jgi:hypothetical protein
MALSQANASPEKELIPTSVHLNQVYAIDEPYIHFLKHRLKLGRLLIQMIRRNGLEVLPVF